MWGGIGARRKGNSRKAPPEGKKKRAVKTAKNCRRPQRQGGQKGCQEGRLVECEIPKGNDSADESRACKNTEERAETWSIPQWKVMADGNLGGPLCKAGRVKGHKHQRSVQGPRDPWWGLVVPGDSHINS